MGIFTVAHDIEVLGDRSQPQAQISGEFADELEALVQTPHVKNVVIETPGQLALAIRPVQKGFVELRIPPTDDGTVSTVPVELAQHVEQRGSRGDSLTGNFMHLGSGLSVFDVPGIDQGLQNFGLAFAIGVEYTGDFDDTVPLDIEPSGFQIDKDELRHACFRLPWGYPEASLSWLQMGKIRGIPEVPLIIAQIVAHNQFFCAVLRPRGECHGGWQRRLARSYCQDLAFSGTLRQTGVWYRGHEAVCQDM